LTLWILPQCIFWGESKAGILHFEFPFQFVISTFTFAVSAVLNLGSAWMMVRVGLGTPLPTDCAPRLVVKGLYRYVRNPMAIGGLGMGYAVGLGNGSWLVIVYVTAGMLFWNFFVRPVEEKDLEQRFGESFSRYKTQVRCWVPRFSFDPGSLEQRSAGLGDQSGK
jgi:protein-S-isoprenylcysteine O-methyltransferase Ste14